MCTTDIYAEVDILALKKFCDFSIPANVDFLGTEIICDFLIPMESLKGKRKKIAKVYFLRLCNLAKNAFKVTTQNFYVYSIFYLCLVMNFLFLL